MHLFLKFNSAESYLMFFFYHSSSRYLTIHNPSSLITLSFLIKSIIHILRHFNPNSSLMQSSGSLSPNQSPCKRNDKDFIKTYLSWSILRIALWMILPHQQTILNYGQHTLYLNKSPSSEPSDCQGIAFPSFANTTFCSEI